MMAKNTAPAAQNDEEVLILSLKTPSLFRILINRYEAAFSRRAASIVGRREEVDDIVVETFSKIYFNARRFEVRPGASFRSWGYKILVNTAFSYYRRLRRQETAILDLDEGGLLRPGLALAAAAEEKEREGEERKDLVERVALVFSRMPRKLSRLLRLHFLEGHPQSEIARSEGLSLAAVKSRIYRAKKIFRKLAISRGEF